MKINRLLTAALIIIASVFTSCVKESVWDVKTGIDSSKAAPEGFSFDATLSSKSEIAVYWQGDKAKAAGAQSFLVQLTDSKNMDKGNTWDSKVSKVLQISDDPTANYESVKFTNLAEGSKYYVRVRANYPGSVYSEWAYIASPEGKPLLCEVGFGPSNPDAAAPESITYNASKSSNSSLAFDVVATAAKAAGASTLAYRLTNYESGLAVIRELPVETLSYAFTELELKSQHKASVAAIYETPEGGIYYSNWVVASETITTDAGQVKTELYEVGTGAVEDKGVRPRIRCNWATSSELGVEYTSTAFANPAADFESEYNVQLYTDAACENLLVSWVLSGKPGADGSIQKRTPEGSSPRFLFSGLDANTTYYAVVTNNNTGMSSAIVPMTTAEFTPVTISDTPAAAGDIILAEDFSELIWGGSLIYEYPGYSADNRDKVPFIKATGVNPVGQTEAAFYLVDSSVEMGLFNTTKVAYPLTRLANWASMTETNTQKGFVLARPGHLKLGASSQIGRIVTPALSSLSEIATIELSFKAALYQTDVTSGGVWVITSSDNLSATQNLITNAEGADSPVYSYDLTTSNEWTTHTVEIKNVTPESRIMIGNVRTAGTVAGTDQQRMFVDDVVIKVVSYGGDAIELVPPTHTSITLTPDERQITATWNPVEGATGYVLAYKKATDGDDAWTEVALGKTQTTYTITGLVELTTYEIKVKATAPGGSESEWSSVVSATTPKDAEYVRSINVAGFFTDAKVTWSAISDQIQMAAYVNGAKVADLPGGTTSYTYTGLTMGTEYTVKIASYVEGTEIFSPEVTFTTANVRQVRQNVGPTHLCIDWDDCSAGSSNTEKLFHIELYKDAAATQPVYSLYTADGQSATGGCYGVSSWLGKKDNSNRTPATRATFGFLEPATTYYFRVRTEASQTFTREKGTFTMGAPAGTSAYSDLVAFTTEAAHVSAANEVLYQGFDMFGMQHDIMNLSAGLTPLANPKTDFTCSSTWADWCVYPFATAHKLATWGYGAEGQYIDGQSTHNSHNNYVVGEKGGSLAGWHYGDEVSPHQGYVKVGTSSKANFYIATPALTSELLETEGTPCTVSFKASALINDSRVIYIQKYNAATGESVTVQEVELAYQCVEGANASSTDHTFAGQWNTYSVDVTLAPGDNIAFCTKDKNRFVIDDILIVKK